MSEPDARRIETLRTFMADIVSTTNLREAARLVGRGREQVRRFVAGDIQRPHKRTLAAIERLWHQSDPSQVGSAPPTIPLCSVLPPGVESASATIREMFKGSEHPQASVVQRWLLNRVRAEYAAIPAQPRKRSNS